MAQELTARFRGASFEARSIRIEGGKKGADHDKPWQTGGSPEDAGNKVRTLRVEGYVGGADARAVHSALMRALEESGPGELVHPTRGRFHVLPVSWSEQESLHQEGGFIQMQILFKEVLFEPTPLVVASQDADLRFRITAFVDALADALDAAFALPDIADAEVLVRDIHTAVAIAEHRFLNALGRRLKEKFATLARILRSTASSMLPNFVATLGANLVDLIRIPSSDARELQPHVDLMVRYEATRDEFQRAFGTPKESARQTKHQAAFAECMLAACAVGASQAALAKTYRRRGQVFAAVEAVQAFEEIFLMETMRYEHMQGWADTLNHERYQANEVVTRELRHILRATLQILLRRSYRAESERRMVLTRERTLLDLAFELYGDIERVDELMEVNTINEPLMLPQGMEVVYYA